mmetsp:Transcript_5290/g.7314  ORF Transcript_5290/g.7314 Transcript_5290/m.7314 type:complete len:82 (-) Transcript_5290:47-292(-)
MKLKEDQLDAFKMDIKEKMKLKEENMDMEKKLMRQSLADANTRYLKVSGELNLRRLIEEAEQDVVILRVKRLHKEMRRWQV